MINTAMEFAITAWIELIKIELVKLELVSSG